MFRRIARVLPLAAMGLCAAQATEMMPKDVHSGHWAAEATRKAFDYGIFKGFPDGTFRGDDALSGYQAAVVAGRIMDQVAKNRVTEDYAQRTDLEDTEKHYANVVAQARLDQDALKAEIESLREELESLKKRKPKVEEKVILDTSPEAARYLMEMKSKGDMRSMPKMDPMHKDEMGAAMEMEKGSDVAMASPKEKPMPKMGAPKDDSKVMTMPGPKREKAPHLWAGAGVIAPAGDTDTGFTWALNWNFAPTSARGIALDVAHSAGLEAGAGNEMDITTASLSYMLQNPSKKNRLGYGLGLSMIKSSFDTPATSAEETDIGYHAMLQYLIGSRYLAELRYTAGGTEYAAGGVSADSDALSIKFLTAAGF